jgi:hypothetical protein
MIAEFHPKDPYSEYDRTEIARNIQTLIEVLGYTSRNVGQLGEQNECWIGLARDYIYVNHKYWSKKQIDCFQTCLRAEGHSLVQESGVLTLARRLPCARHTSAHAPVVKLSDSSIKGLLSLSVTSCPST